MEQQPFSINIITFTLALLFFIIIKLLFKHKNNKYKNLPPSPPSLPIIGHLHLVRNSLHRSLAGLADRYGPVVLLRFGVRRVLVVSSVSAAEECLKTNDVIFANRPCNPILKDFTYNFTTLGSMRYGPLWRNFRRITTLEVFSNHRLLSFVDVRAHEVHALARLLLRKHSEGSDNDSNGFARITMKTILFELAMNIVVRMIAGKRYYGEGSESSEAARKFVKVLEDSTDAVSKTFLGDMLPVLGWLDNWRVKKELETSRKARDDLLQDMLDEHRRIHNDNEHANKKTMMGNLLELQKTDPESNSDVIIKALTMSLIAAGTGTTPDTIEWAMTLLLNHPDGMKKLRAEIDEHVGNDRLLEETDIGNLPYLQCVINETLRLCPPTPMLLPHESSEDCVVQGYDVPKGTMLLVNIYAIQRDANVWQEPLEFKPERHEVGGGWMIPFGMGRRKCVGEGLAIKVVGLTLGILIQNFEWKRVGDEKVDMAESSGIAASKVVPLEAMYRPRPEMMGTLSKLL